MKLRMICILISLTLLPACQSDRIMQGQSVAVRTLPYPAPDPLRQTPAPTPTDQVIEAAMAKPPSATLTVGAEQQGASLGSYCWASVCGDGPVITPAQSVATQTPFTLEFRAQAPEQPHKLRILVYHVLDQDGTRLGTTEHRVWRLTPGPYATHEVTLQDPLPLDLDPGLYVLNVIADWPVRGRVNYGFFVQVT